ncbi:hypothetical protein BVV20_21580 [Xanthomonas oryzae pv. oryzae]|nr:hypothetical protein BVV20_21580 [Xanthomonas oryzae pv. oryzae]
MLRPWLVDRLSENSRVRPLYWPSVTVADCTWTSPYGVSVGASSGVLVVGVLLEMPSGRPSML